MLSHQDHDQEPLGLLLVLAAAVLWGLLGVFTAGLLRAGLGAIEIAFWRALIAGTVFAGHAIVARTLRPFAPRALTGAVLFALIGVTMFYVAIAYAVDTGGVSLAFILLYTAPAWVTLLASPLLGEHASPRQWFFVALAIVGVAVVSLARGEGVTPSTAAIAWGLASGLGYASYYLLGKRLLEGRPPEVLYGLVLPLGALGILPFVSFEAKTLTAWVLLLGLSVISTYGAYLLYGLGLRRSRASRAVLVATVEPVIAIALAWLIFGERFGVWGWLGALLVLGAAVGQSVGAKRSPVTNQDSVSPP